MRGLLLVGAKRTQLALGLEQLLHRLRTQCARQLVLQVGVARIEAERLEIGAREARAKAGTRESAPEVALLRGVVETGETDTEPRRTVPLKEAAQVPIATHRHHRHAFRIE